MNPPVFYDNINKRLIDGLRETIERSDRVSVAGSAFSVYAFEALRKEFARHRRISVSLHVPRFFETRHVGHPERMHLALPRSFSERFRNTSCSRSPSRAKHVWSCGTAKRSNRLFLTTKIGSVGLLWRFEGRTSMRFGFASSVPSPDLSSETKRFPLNCDGVPRTNGPKPESPDSKSNFARKFNRVASTICTGRFRRSKAL